MKNDLVRTALQGYDPNVNNLVNNEILSAKNHVLSIHIFAYYINDIKLHSNVRITNQEKVIR